MRKSAANREWRPLRGEAKPPPPPMMMARARAPKRPRRPKTLVKGISCPKLYTLRAAQGKAADFDAEEFYAEAQRRGESQRGEGKYPLYLLFIPRHSRESGNPESPNQDSRAKPSPNRNQQIPSPLMGEG